MSLFNRAGSSSARQFIDASAYAAFDDDDEADEQLSTAPVAGATVIRVNHYTTLSNSADAEDDHTASHEAGATLPGSYDFEPQGYDGAPSIESRTRPSAIHPSSVSPLGAAVSRTLDGRGPIAAPSSLLARFLPAGLTARLGLVAHEADASNIEGHGLLFSQDTEEDDEHAAATQVGGTPQPSYPPRSTPSHVPLPARPPAFPVPRSGRVFGGGGGNDGVFANLSAKPDQVQGADGLEFVGGDEGGSGDKDAVLPTYELAALDSTPPYWETTVLAPQGILGPDEICVDGLPVGNFFSFAWNLLVSMSFQFVGFLLTYLLHTTHAAKNGSRAGLGITLIQLGLYLKQRKHHLTQVTIPGDATGLGGFPGPTPTTPTAQVHAWSWWSGSRTAPALSTATSTALVAMPTSLSAALKQAMTGSSDAVNTMPSLGAVTGAGGETIKMNSTTNEIMAFALVIFGSFLLVGALLNYWRAVRFARAIQQGMGPGADAEQHLVE